jgi:hypothetical protein
VTRLSEHWLFVETKNDMSCVFAILSKIQMQVPRDYCTFRKEKKKNQREAELRMPPTSVALSDPPLLSELGGLYAALDAASSSLKGSRDPIAVAVERRIDEAFTRLAAASTAAKDMLSLLAQARAANGAAAAQTATAQRATALAAIAGGGGPVGGGGCGCGCGAAAGGCAHRSALADRVIDRTFDAHRAMLRERLTEAEREIARLRNILAASTSSNSLAGTPPVLPTTAAAALPVVLPPIKGAPSSSHPAPVPVQRGSDDLVARFLEGCRARVDAADATSTAAAAAIGGGNRGPPSARSRRPTPPTTPLPARPLAGMLPSAWAEVTLRQLGDWYELASSSVFGTLADMALSFVAAAGPVPPSSSELVDVNPRPRYVQMHTPSYPRPFDGGRGPAARMASRAI